MATETAAVPAVAGPARHERNFSDRAAVVVFPLIVIVLAGVPLVFLLWGSVRTGALDSPGAAFTIKFWRTAYGSSTYLRPLLNTVTLSVVVSVVSTALGSLLAWFIARTNLPGRRWLGVLLSVPFVFSPLITTLAWVALAAPNSGFLNAIVHPLLGGQFFNIYSFGGIGMVMVLHFTPIAYIAMIPAFGNVGGALEEASRMLGAGALRTLIKTTLPLVIPAILSSLLVVFVLSAETFSVPTLLGASIHFLTLPSEIYDLMEETGSGTGIGQAAALGTMLLWIALAGTLWQRSITRRSRRYVTVIGKSATVTRIRLGGWRWFGFALSIVYLLLAIGLPLAALVVGSFMSFITSSIRPGLFTLRNWLTILQPETLGVLAHTVLLCLVTTVALTLFSVILAYVLQRRLPRRLSAVTEQFAILPGSISGMVIAIGFIWTFLSLPLGIYGTWLAIGIAFFAIYLGNGVRMANAALLQIAPDLEEAARVQGASGIRIFLTVTWPLIRTAALSFGTLSFVLMFLEINAVILLYAPSTQTFSVVIWTSLAAGSTTQAITMAVVQSLVIIVFLGLGQRLFGTMRHLSEGDAR